MLKEFGKVDILVNAAGITHKAATLEVDEADWSRVIDINLNGTLRACQIFGTTMVQAGYGRIINIASLTSFVGFFQVAAYSAQKAAVASLTKVLAVELAQTGVNVNAIAPGMFPDGFECQVDHRHAARRRLHMRMPMAPIWRGKRTCRRGDLSGFGGGFVCHGRDCCRRWRFPGKRREPVARSIGTSESETSPMGNGAAETMKISNAYVNITSPGRNFVTLKIETDEGIYGLGDGTLNGRELAVASYLTEHVIPCIIGRDPFQTEDIWQYLYRGAYWRRGPVTMAAIAAVDIALWDIKGKALNTPVYNLLGGKSREGVLVYAHANGKDIDQALEDVARHKDLGYKAIRVQSGFPDLRRPMESRKRRGDTSLLSAGLPAEYEWATEPYLRHVPNLFARVREAFGEELHLLHDCHHRLTPIEAGRLGQGA